MPNTHKVVESTLTFSDEDAKKTKDTANKLLQTLSSQIASKNEDLSNQVTMLKAYNTLMELCIETRKLQNAAMQASRDNNGPLLKENYDNARAKFKEVQSQVKKIKAAEFDKVLSITGDLLDVKKSGEKFYQVTAVSSNEMIKHITFLKQLGDDIASGKIVITPSAQVPAPSTATSSAASTTPRTQASLPSAYDAKRTESKIKAENANKVGGSAAQLNNLNIKK